MYRLEIRVLAQEDIQNIVTYYDEKAPFVTDRFLNVLYSEFEGIQKRPALFQKKYKETRVRYIAGFPFGIHYILKGETVVVLAVLHTSRNPKIWEKR